MSLLTASMSSTALVTDGQFELGSYYMGNVHSSYEVSLSQRFSDNRFFFSTMIIEGTDEAPIVPLVSLSYTITPNISIKAGRIGIPFGSTPAIYTSRPPVASFPNIYPSILRTVVKTVAISDFGVAYEHQWESVLLSARAYKGRDIPIETAAAFVLQFGLIPDPPNFADVPTADQPPCDICDLIESESDGVLVDSIQTQGVGLIGQAIGVCGTSDECVEESGQTLDGVSTKLHISAEYEQKDHRVVFDVLIADALQTNILVTNLAADIDYKYGIAGGQMTILYSASTQRRVLGTFLWATMNQWYIRGGIFAEVSEIGIGRNFHYNQFSLRLGAQQLTILGESNTYPELAVSVQF